MTAKSKSDLQTQITTDLASGGGDITAETVRGLLNDILDSIAADIPSAGVVRFGSASNYLQINADGHMTFVGDATVWDDLRFPAARSQQGSNLKPDYDETENGLLFPQNNTGEIAYYISQLPHGTKMSVISPHVHYIQDEASLPTFKLKYRITNGGETPGAWTTLTSSATPVFTYVSGSILQVLTFADIDISGAGLSAIIDFQLWRDDNTVTGDVLVKEFDTHWERSSIGSDQETF